MSLRDSPLLLPRHGLLGHVREDPLGRRRPGEPRRRLRDRLHRQLRGRSHRPRRQPRCRGRPVVATGFLVAFLVVYLVGYFNLDTAVAATQYGKGMTKFAIHFLFLILGVAYLARASRDVLLADARLLHGRHGRQRRLRAPAAAARALGHDLDQAILSPITGGASYINIYGAVDGANIYRPNALTGDPNHLGVMLDHPAARAHARLPPAGAWPPAGRSPLAVTLALPVPRRADDAVAERDARPDRRPGRARAPVPPLLPHAGVPGPARRRSSGCSASSSSRGSSYFERIIRRA